MIATMTKNDPHWVSAPGVVSALTELSEALPDGDTTPYPDVSRLRMLVRKAWDAIYIHYLGMENLAVARGLARTGTDLFDRCAETIGSIPIGEDADRRKALDDSIRFRAELAHLLLEEGDDAVHRRVFEKLESERLARGEMIR
ncbi:MAG: hypothetical protein Greene041619_491 [Candidatus Peregrinibacteria bacterium Greene0416_19]|nr:MAG: hypothetical protein Greene041619_491 [Candidatus Peregrinibacteria bacterium Greene0416_19]